MKSLMRTVKYPHCSIIHAHCIWVYVLPKSNEAGWGLATNFQLLMLSPNLLRSQISYIVGEGLATNFQLSKFPIWCGDGGKTNASAKFMNLSPHLKFLFRRGGGGGQFPTFDAESKFAKALKKLQGVLLKIF